MRGKDLKVTGRRDSRPTESRLFGEDRYRRTGLAIGGVRVPGAVHRLGRHYTLSKVQGHKQRRRWSPRGPGQRDGLSRLMCLCTQLRLSIVYRFRSTVGPRSPEVHHTLSTRHQIKVIRGCETVYVYVLSK